MTFPLPGRRPWEKSGVWRLVRQGGEGARGLRKEEAEVVLRKPGGSCATNVEVAVFLKSRREVASRTVVVVAYSAEGRRTLRWRCAGDRAGYQSV